MIRRYLPLLLSVLTVAMVFAPPTVAQSAGDAPELFQDTAERISALNSVGVERMGTLKQASTTRSIRLVRLADDLLQQRVLTMQVDRGTRVLASSVNPAFQRNSENEGSSGRMVELFIQRDGIKAISEDAYAWNGTVRIRSASRVPAGTKVGDVTLVHGKEGDITGTIRVGGEYYLVRPLNGGVHALVEVNEKKYPSGGTSPLHDGGSSQEGSWPASTSKPAVQTSPSLEESSEETCSAAFEVSASEDENSRIQQSGGLPSPAASCPQKTVDALVVYTSAAASGQNIDGLINTAIQEANEAYSNSNAYNTDLTLAHSQQVGIDFGDIRTIGDDLGDLQADGTVQSLRDQHDADVVVLLTDDVYGSIAGQADEIRAEAGDAYAIVAAPFATGGNYTFPHEVGHLQGAQHHPGDPTCPPGSSCDSEGDLISGAFGHRFEDDKLWCGWLCGPEYATMMAYTLGGDYTRVKHFSNPNVTLDDKPTGTSSRYNADALRTTDNTVENFRISDELRAHFSISDGSQNLERIFTANPCGGTGSYSYEWRISYNEPFNYGSPVSSQKSFSTLFPEGTHFVRLTVTSGSQTDTAIQTVSITCEQDPCPTVASMASDEASASSKQSGEKRPEQMALHMPTPNPVRTVGTIAYELPERTDVRLAVYDLMGRRVASLASGARGAGTHRVRFDGSSLPSGIYVVRLRAGGQQKTQRITVVK